MTREEVESFVDDMIKNFVDDRLMVDPPSGWRYGFPKPYFKNAITDSNELNTWLVSEGYPQQEIDRFDNHFPVRLWIQRD